MNQDNDVGQAWRQFLIIFYSYSLKYFSIENKLASMIFVKLHFDLFVSVLLNRSMWRRVGLDFVEFFQIEKLRSMKSILGHGKSKRSTCC